MFFLTLLQLQVFIWLGTWFFKSVSTNEQTSVKKVLWRLLLFYLTVLSLSFMMFMGIFSYHFIKKGGDFSQFFAVFFRLDSELNSFFSATAVGFGFGAIFFFYSQWAEAVKRMKKLKEEKLIFQYETLKTQVNPHFLFNSLNTLSSLVSHDVKLSEQFIQKLSSVYRYVLENQEKELVSLSAEMAFVNDYYYLQKIRDAEKISLKLELPNHNAALIMPVSIQMLLENALKHNAATRKQPLEITIHFEGIDKIVVRNTLQAKTRLSESSKIGLKNLNERCKLILNREIEVQKNTHEFVVKVPVKLQKIV
jgi:sensor histidine kinase YesM